MSLKQEIITYAESEGAGLVGVAQPGLHTDYLEEVRNQLQATGATGMDYMLPNDALSFFGSLSDARRTLAAARSIILLGAYSRDREGNYAATRRKLQGKTARTYAYYPVVRQIAEQVALFIEAAGYEAIQGQHIPLKQVAHDIGLGAYGWNGLLLTPDYGSYLALRAVITDAELEPDVVQTPQLPCADCGRCLKACPTGALYAPYKINPKLCINPLTRKEDNIPFALRKKMGNWVCGCDICQDVCPLNQGLEPRRADSRAGFDPSHHASHRTLGGLARCPDLKALLENERMPVMQRNAIIALANIGTDGAIDIIRRYEGTNTGRLGHYRAWALDQAKPKTG